MPSELGWSWTGLDPCMYSVRLLWTDLICSVLCLNRPPSLVWSAHLFPLLQLSASLFPAPFPYLSISAVPSPSRHLSPSLSHPDTRKTRGLVFSPYPPSTVSYHIVLLLAVLTALLGSVLAITLFQPVYYLSRHYILYCILLLPIMVITASSA
ncbi:hypothetical protein V8C34DRAFT_288943 [Trichoderma compactum]